MATTPSAAGLVPLGASAEDEPEALARRLTNRDLPVLHGGEIERMVGFVRVVRLLGGMLGLLGLLAAFAGASLGLPLLGVGSTVLTTVILYALWEDTRLATALELLRRNRPDAAEAALARIATSSRRSPWQRQRARTYLASLAWRRGDVDQALHWIQARLSSPRAARHREDPTERWLARATEIQLLALTGRGAEAQEALARQRPPPPDEHAELTAATSALLVAFVRDDADAVRDRIDGWEPMIRERDGLGTGLALLAWANAGRGARDRAIALVREARRRADDGYVARHYPRLWQWVERYGDGFRYGRR